MLKKGGNTGRLIHLILCTLGMALSETLVRLSGQEYDIIM